MPVKTSHIDFMFLYLCFGIRYVLDLRENLLNRWFITARKRSLRRLCFYSVLSVHGWGHAWLLWGGGMCGWSQGGHAWLVGGGMCGWSRGGCVVGPGGACMVAPEGGGHAWDTMRYGDTINERAVRILLECILVVLYFWIRKLCNNLWFPIWFSDKGATPNPFKFKVLTLNSLLFNNDCQG